MTKILVGEMKQETSSFNPVPTAYHDFVIQSGQSILDFHQGKQSELGGALDIFAAAGEIELIPTYSARAITSGGPITDETIQRILDEFLAQVRAAPPVDAVYLSLHGAMAAPSEDDPEGLLLQEIRRILGTQIPIVVSMDLHGIAADRIFQHADAVVNYHTFPHVDFYPTGQRAARALLRILAGARPVMVKVDVPVLFRGTEMITASGLYGEFIRRCQALEADPAGLSAGIFIGNPFTDVAELACNPFVVMDGDEEAAKEAVLALAQDFWAVRERLQLKLMSLSDSVAQAQANLGRGTSALIDAADATSSGASGDSNAILRALQESGYQGRVLAPIVDPGAVQAAKAAGVGNRVQTTVGGKLDRGRYTPLPIDAHVHMISDGCIISESFRSPWFAGESAVLQTAHATIVATSRPVSLYDRALFLAHGQDPKHFDAVIVKSPYCEPQFFSDWVVQMIDVDAPGSTSANVRSLGHVRNRRPLYPLQMEIDWEPEVKVFGRVNG